MIKKGVIMQQKVLGYLLLIAAQVSIGVSLVVAKVIYAKGVPVYQHIQFRFLFCVLFLMLAVFLRHLVFKPKQALVQQFSARDGLLTVGQSLSGGVLFNIFMMYGLIYTTATQAGIIGSIIPAMIALFSYFILKEQLGGNKIFAIVLAMMGIVVLHLDTVGHATASNAFLGNFLVLMAIIPEVLYTIFTKMLKGHIHPLLQAALINLMSVLVFFPAWLMWGGMGTLQELSQPAFLLIGFSGFLSMIFYYFWNAGLRSVSASTAGIITGVMPIAASLSAVVYLGERFTFFDGVGMCFVLCSIWIGARTKTQTPSRSSA